LQFLLAGQSKLAKPQPQPAVHYLELGAFLGALAKHEGARHVAIERWTDVRT
jgi:hypothetical protein